MVWSKLIIFLVVLQLFESSNAIYFHLDRIGGLMASIGPIRGTQSCQEIERRETRQGITRIANVRRTLRESLANITAQLTVVDSAISKMNIQQNQLSGQGQRIVDQGKSRLMELNDRERLLAELRTSVEEGQRELQRLDAIYNQELMNLQAAREQFNNVTQQRPPPDCFGSCLVQFGLQQNRRIMSANVTLQEATRRMEKAAADRGNLFGSLEIRGRGFSMAVASFMAYNSSYQQFIGQILNATNLRQNTLNLLNSLTRIKRSVISFEQRLTDIVSIFKGYNCTEQDEEIWLLWEMVYQGLSRPTRYINNRGFEGDLFNWGVRVTGFDVPSLITLGIEHPENDIQFLNM